MCIYKCLLIIIFIKFVECADKYPYKPNDTGGVGEGKNNDDQNNFDLIEKELENIIDDDNDSNSLVKGIQKILEHDCQPSQQQEYNPYLSDYDASGAYGYTYQHEQQNVQPGGAESILYKQNFFYISYSYPGVTGPPLPIPVSQLVIQDTPIPGQQTSKIFFETHPLSVPIKLVSLPQPNIEPGESEKTKFTLPALKTTKLPEINPLNESTAPKQPINTGKGKLPIPKPGIIVPAPSLLTIPSNEINKPKEPQPQESQPMGLYLTVEVEFNVTQAQPTETTEPNEQTDADQSSASASPDESEQTTTGETELVKELEPERVVVEVGSDEEDQDDQSSGDGQKDQKSDQPSDQPSGSGGAEGGDEKAVYNGLEYMGLKSMIFFKKNEKGVIIEMSPEDYEVIWNDKNKAKFKFYADLEMIMYNEEEVYKHRHFRSYIKFLVYNKKFDIFTGRRKDELFMIMRIDGEWFLKPRRIPSFVKLYTVNSEGNDVLLTEEHYIIELSAFESVKFIMMRDAKCNKITVKDMVAWKKTKKDKEFPSVICITNRYNILVYFEQYVLTYRRKNEKYVLLECRENKKDY